MRARTAATRLDEIDAQLLDLLQHDAGRPLHDLCQRVGLSPSAVQRRIAHYRNDGLITRQVTVLDPHRLGRLSNSRWVREFSLVVWPVG